jgi:hypothetical protein
VDDLSVGCQLRTDIRHRKVVRRVVGVLPDEERTSRVGDELTAQEGADSLRALLYADATASHRRGGRRAAHAATAPGMSAASLT